MALCRDCHEKLHAGEVGLGRKGRTFAWRALAVLGKAYLLLLLGRFGEIRTCEGWQTEGWRKALGLPKCHANDAACLFPCGPLKFFGPEHMVWPLRRRRWEGNPTRTCEERNGFRHWDVVRAERAGRFVFGCVRSLKARALALRTASDRNFEVSYSKARVLHRPRRLAYVPTC